MTGVEDGAEHRTTERMDLALQISTQDQEGKTINITENVESQGDVQAGIEFIYNMREHMVDVTIATAYLLVVYAIYMWIKKKLS